MFEEENLQRATILYQQKRFTDAEKAFGVLLTSDPSNGYYHSMVALCLMEQNKKEKALNFALEGTGASPAESFCHYVVAIVALNLEQSGMAESYINEALSLDPAKADYYEVKALLALGKKEWAEALVMADQGLSVDPEHIGCLNMRATAQVKMGNKDDAYTTINEALYFDPENAHTHANLGWGLLEKGEHKKSLDHFRQALLFDPGNEYAKAGMVEALKARYWFYRMFLKYAFWIGNKKGNMQWAILIGFYVGSRVVIGIGKIFPEAQFITTPLIVLYVLFALTTWIITPLSDLFLRLNVYGKHALDEQEIKCSNFLGISLTLSFIAGIIYLFNQQTLFMMLWFLFLTMCVPVASIFKVPQYSKGRKILAAYALGMLLVGSCSIAVFLGNGDEMNTFSSVYFLAFFIYQWVANAFIIR